MYFVILTFKNGGQKFLNTKQKMPDDLLSLDCIMTLEDDKTKASITFHTKDLMWYEQTTVKVNEKVSNKKPKKRF